VKAAGAAKVIVSGQFFGAGDALDAYLIAFLIPSFLGDVFVGALNPAFIPAFIETGEREGQEPALALYASVLYRSVVFFSIAAVLLLVCSNPVLSLVASGFPPAKLALTRTLLGYMTCILPLTAVSVIWRSVLNAHNRFAMAAIAPVMTPVVTIAAVIAGTPHFGVAALAAGTTLGATAELVALFGALRRSKIPAFPRLRWRSAEVARVLQQYWPIVVSSAVMGGSTIVDQTMAAMLGSGSVSALNFGTRVSGVLLAVGPAALSTALFPRLSAMSARGEWRDLGSMLRRYLLLGAVLTVPVACALAWLSEPIARVVFERGAFVPRDTRVVAAVQAFSFLQLPIAVALALLLRAVASLRANVVLIKVSVLALGANAALNYVLMHRMGVAGIALSTTAVHSLVLILAGTIVFRRLGSLVLFEGKHTSNVEVGDS